MNLLGLEFMQLRNLMFAHRNNTWAPYENHACIPSCFPVTLSFNTPACLTCQLYDKSDFLYIEEVLFVFACFFLSFFHYVYSFLPLDCSFMGVPPSLLASACLCDAVAHMASEEHSRCVETLADLAGLEKVHNECGKVYRGAGVVKYFLARVIGLFCMQSIFIQGLFTFKLMSKGVISLSKLC